MEGVDSFCGLRPQNESKSLYVLLDCSGSMVNQEAEVINGTNSVLDAIYAMQNEDEAVDVEIYTFNTSSTQLVPLTRLTKTEPRLKCEDLQAGGYTALYDVVGEVLVKCAQGATLLIATDGEDTASKEYSPCGIEELIERCRNEKRVRFVFVAAGSNAYAEASKMGLCEYECTQVNDNESLGTALASQPVVESLSQALAGMAEGHAVETDQPSKRKRAKVAPPADAEAIEIYSQDYD